jgi:hypothetical protein
MLSTKSLISELNEIPREWVFEFYLKLDERLCGQDVRIKSPFNPSDKNPSFYVHFSRSLNKYIFKDFSTDKKGDGITLVQSLLDLSTRGEAAHKVISDYNQFILNNNEDYSLRDFKIQQKYKVTDWKTRNWTNVDQKYWTKFHIGSKLLEQYNVKPLDSYKMTKEENGKLHELEIKGKYCIYGYFRSDGSLYKIYQPLVKDNKFIKVKDYIQGTDQLNYASEYLIILSSLKDILGFKKLGYTGIEAIAPDSENNLIPSNVMTSYKLKFKGICTLFDNDKAGIEAMQKYTDKYQVKGITLPLSKDLTDSMKDHGLGKVKTELNNLLKEALT